MMWVAQLGTTRMIRYRQDLNDGDAVAAGKHRNKRNVANKTMVYPPRTVMDFLLIRGGAVVVTLNQTV